MRFCRQDLRKSFRYQMITWPGKLSTGLSALCLLFSSSISLAESTSSAQRSGGNAFHPIVDATAGQLFGAVAGSEWLASAVAARRLTGAERYRLYYLTGHLAPRLGSKARPPEESCSNYRVTIKALPNGYEAIFAVAGRWDALPRVPTSEDSNNPVYRGLVADLLHTQGITAPEVNISQVLNVDLEGDGERETLISAHQRRGQGTSAREGDYALIVLQRQRQGKTEIIPVVQEYFPRGCVMECAPAIYRIAAILDVNGDGVQEIIVGFDYYEAKGKTIYMLEHNRFVKRLSWTCGV